MDIESPRTSPDSTAPAPERAVVGELRSRSALAELAWLQDAIVHNQNDVPHRSLQPLDAGDVLSHDMFAVVRGLYMPRLLEAQAQRRVQLSPEITLRFENRSTVLFRLHETLLQSGRWDPEFVQATLDDCRRLLPTNGLAATVDVHAAGDRERFLTKELSERPFETLCLFVGNRWFDARPVSLAGALPASGGQVYFELPGLAPAALVDPALSAELAFVIDDELVETPLPAQTRVALSEDLQRCQKYHRRAESARQRSR